MYVDASAILGIMKGEADRSDLLERLHGAPDLITSPITAFEAAIGFRSLSGSTSSAASEVSSFLSICGIRQVSIDESYLIEFALARDRYGKDSGHSAQLNLGDCVSYGIAKSLRVPMLYKGNDFALTDLR